MGSDDFMDAMFELADVWTVGIDAEEYVAFLRSILDRVRLLPAQLPIGGAVAALRNGGRSNEAERPARG